MHSPLPDSSALEAGILEDERPSRLSQVHDNVRNLLRTSVFGSVVSSPTTSLDSPQQQHHIVSPPPVLHFYPSRAGPEVLPSPTSTVSTVSTTSTKSTPHISNEATTPTATTTNYRNIIQRMAHQSALFNSRAVAALNHPDLSDPSLEDLNQCKSQNREQQQQQRRGGDASTHSNQTSKKKHKRKRRVPRGTNKAQVLFCVLSAVLLAALVATYLALITTSPGTLSTTFHIIFILGILLATILFAHSLARLCILPSNGKTPSASSARQDHHHHRRRHHRRHHDHHQDRSAPSSASSFRSNPSNRSIPNLPSHLLQPPPLTSANPGPGTSPEETQTFVPTIPIPVVCASDTASSSSSSLPPPALAALPRESSSRNRPEELASQRERHWNRALSDDDDEDEEDPAATAAATKANPPLPPPPAYGRWRGSVRANPELLHWAVVGGGASSRNNGEGEEVPSPGYEENFIPTTTPNVPLLLSPRGLPLSAGGLVDRRIGGSEELLPPPPSYVTREDESVRRGDGKGGFGGEEEGKEEVPEMVEVGGGSSLSSQPVVMVEGENGVGGRGEVFWREEVEGKA